MIYKRRSFELVKGISTDTERLNEKSVSPALQGSKINLLLFVSSLLHWKYVSDTYDAIVIYYRAPRLQFRYFQRPMCEVHSPNIPTNHYEEISF